MPRRLRLVLFYSSFSLFFYSCLSVANQSGRLQAREGPVQFEKDATDLAVDKFLDEVAQSATAKRGFGLQDEESRKAKRPRVDDDDDED